MKNNPSLDNLKAATTRRDLAKLLNVKLVFLTNVLYRLGVDNQYSNFPIPKKNGGVRIISAPSSKLKDLQSKIASLLINCRQEIFAINGVENKL
ncbi:ribonuclease H, partial [Cronobacter sakazakii]